jgi:hypothetical protein
MIIKAKFAGKCAACDQRIKIGEKIAYEKGIPVAHELCREEVESIKKSGGDQSAIDAYVDAIAEKYGSSDRVRAERKVSLRAQQVRWTRALAEAGQEAARPTAKKPQRMHRPDCDAQIPGNPCTCAYE